MGRTAESIAAKVKLTREQKALIHLAQRCQHTVDQAVESRKARDGALRQLGAEGVPAAAIYTLPTGKGRAALARNTIDEARRGRR